MILYKPSPEELEPLKQEAFQGRHPLASARHRRLDRQWR